MNEMNERNNAVIDLTWKEFDILMNLLNISQNLRLNETQKHKLNFYFSNKSNQCILREIIGHTMVNVSQSLSTWWILNVCVIIRDYFIHL